MTSFLTLEDLLYAVPLLAIYAYVVLKLAFKEKADIVNTGDDGILITLGNVLLLGGMLVSILFGIFSLYFTTLYIEDSTERLFSYVFMVMLVIPILGFLYQYLNLKKFYVKKFKLSELSPLGELHPFIKKIEDLSKKTHLKKSPKILISEFYNLQPFVFGYNENRNYLVLPKNYYNLISDNTLTKNQKETLGKFLYLHELSHISNKDLGFISVSFVLLRIIWPWLLIILTITPLLFFSFHYLSKISLFFYLFAVPILFLSYMLLSILYFTLSKKREYLADARALLNMEPEEVNYLHKENLSFGEETKTLFEYLLLRLKILPVFIKRKTIEKGTKKIFWRVEEIKNTIFKYFKTLSLHPEDSERSKSLKEKEVFYESKISPSKTSSIFIGAITAILVNIVMNIAFLITFYEALFDVNLNLLGNWFLFLMALLLIFFPTIFFNLPLSSSINKKIKPGNFIKQFATSYVISLIAFIIVSELLVKINMSFFHITHLENMKLENFLISERRFLIIVYTCIILLSLGTSFVIREKVFKEELGEVVLVFIITVLFFFGLVLLLGVIYYANPIHVHVVFATEAALLFFIYQKFFSGGLINNKAILNFGKKNFIIDYNKKRPIKMLFKFIIAGAVIGIVYLGLPMVIFHAILLKSIRLFPVLGEHFTSVLIGFTFFVLFAVFIKGPKYRLEDIEKRIEIERELGISTSKKYNIVIKDLLDQKKTSTGGYLIIRSYGIPFMEGSYYGALLEKYLYGKIKDETMKWILECEDNAGGFKDYKGGFGHLESTYFALDILKKEKLLEKILRQKHTKWLIDKSDSILQYMHYDKGALSNLFYCIESLEILSPESIKEIPIVEEMVIFLWNKCYKNFENLFYILKILSRISPRRSPILESFKVLWLDVFWKSILKVDLRENSKDLFFFISSVKSLKPDNAVEIFESIREKLSAVP